MTKKYFENFAGSIEELELLIESERAYTAAAIDAAFRHDAEAAVIRISEINQIANARILAAAQIASAKAATDAEVAAATLAGLASSAVHRITSRQRIASATPGQAATMVRDTAELAHQTISEFASDAVLKINAEAEGAINRIKENGNAAIDQVKTLVAEIDLEITANDAEAAETLERLKSDQRSTADIVENAASALTLMRNQFKAFTQRLSVITEATKAEMHEYTEEAISTISRATESAARRIFQSRDKALKIIREIIDENSP
jgi:hypothetical protein